MVVLVAVVALATVDKDQALALDLVLGDGEYHPV
jgi:hypothetical protein